MTTLKLTDDWDITLNDKGNILTTNSAEAIAQSVATACRLFLDDAYYAKDKGIPYFDIALGVSPTESIIRTRLKETALTVNSVKDAEVIVTDFSNRSYSGVINISLYSGGVVNVKF